MLMMPMYECWGFGSSGNGMRKRRGSNFAMGNIERSAGGLNLCPMRGNVERFGWKNCGNGLLRRGKEESMCILSASARL